MAPKRKRGVDENRTTRSSTRSNKGVSEPNGTGSIATNKSEDIAISELDHGKAPTKRPKANDNHAQSGHKKKSKVEPKSSRAAADNVSSYQKGRMEALFTSFAEDDNASQIGAEGLERLCSDANISMEGPQPLILAWLLEASAFGQLSKEEWTKGMHSLKIDTLQKLGVALREYEELLVLNSKPIPEGAPSLYNRKATYASFSAHPWAASSKLYQFVFSLVKSSGERSIDVEIAKAFWSTLLVPRFPLVKEFVDYISEEKKIKGVNKDLWSMSLDFFHTVTPDLKNFDFEGAWPSIIDDFVMWKRKNTVS